MKEGMLSILNGEGREKILIFDATFPTQPLSYDRTRRLFLQEKEAMVPWISMENTPTLPKNHRLCELMRQKFVRDRVSEFRYYFI